MQCKFRTNKKIIICSLLTVLLILGFTIVNIGSNSAIEVHAAGNTPIYT